METTNYFQDIPYQSKITPQLIVISGDDSAKIEELKQQGVPIIGTHSQSFHCDEVLATAMLLYTNKFKDSAIVRTRDDKLFDTFDIICDVGAVFDAEKLRFDHHQKSFNTYWSENDTKDNGGIKLSSAGLIYKYFGKEVLANILQEVWQTSYTEENLDQIYSQLYLEFFKEIDAIDNGVTLGKDLNYQIRTDLSYKVSRFNKEWNAPKEKNEELQFKKAMRCVEEELMYQIKAVSQIYLPARIIVEDAWKNKDDFHPSGEIIFVATSCPWKDHLFEIEESNGKQGLIKFVIYKDNRGLNRVQAVGIKGDQFGQRVTLSKKWHGLRKNDFDKIEGFEFKDLDFVHHSGFIGGAWSMETAIKMAEISIQEHNEEQATKVAPLAQEQKQVE
ncbi:UNKNOWN [Stylonychia lemnae]|uniref:Uncharacterized protein n=1 Tax=Stylonychia lemnae TaxID=5949 RepID=A0A078AR23_STYLE|nr:UNKNOWN [Stylonychia lemnae]|eukprot:CDW84406.1 UNKNOWN [Stylonychia lemnae]